MSVTSLVGQQTFPADYQLMSFHHFQIVTGLWLSACEECRQVVAFSEGEEQLQIAERCHRCEKEGLAEGQDSSPPQAA
jgi:hypothetical protein